MAAERWQRLSALFHRALQQLPGKRQILLDEECAGDSSLRADLDRLLAAHEHAGAFGDVPLSPGDSSPLTIGSFIATYRIIELIGIGGMGEVYRARDERLARDVAIKVLPREFTTDPDRLARIEREARALAALNHPNIATIHGLENPAGTRALIMELVDGETLARRIEQAHASGQPLPIQEVLTIARQVALALDAAHEKGIVHRDLKPANIMITSAGTVKVLDFGLAKSIDQVDDLRADSRPGDAQPAADQTQAGMVIGTAAYMSPEQARGLLVDRRSDVWAFGCVLYEMLTGSSPFAGADARDTVARILRQDPDLAALPPETPAGIRRLLTLCLEKDRAKRLAHIAVAIYEIDATMHEGAELPGGRPRRRVIVPLALVASAAALLAVAMTWSFAISRGTNRPAPVARLMIDVAPAQELGGVANSELPHGNAEQFERLFGTGSNRPSGTALALSPDGTALVFSGVDAGRRALYLRRFDGVLASRIPDTDGGVDPFFSPDGRWVAFWANGELRRVALEGGPAQTIIATPVTFGASWGSDDRIIFARAAGGLWAVAAAGGTPTQIVAPDEARGEVSCRLPHVLPGADAVLFTVTRSRFPRWDEAEIHVYSRRSGVARKLVDSGADARYAPSGHLVFVREAVLVAAPFDLHTLEITGTPVAVLQGLMQSAYAIGTLADTGAGQYSISPAGTLVYARGGTTPSDNSPIVRVDRAGRATGLLEPRPYVTLRVSPDGTQLAASTSGRDRDIWLHSLTRGTLTRRPATGRNSVPVWSRDGQWIAYASAASGADQLHRIRADGSGAPELLLARRANLVPAVFVADDHEILYYELTTGATTSPLIWKAGPGGEASSLDIPGGPAGTGGVDLSADGHWLAYHSAETGRPEVYVQAYPGPGPRYQVSADGGLSPVWRADGRELFFVRPTSSRDSERVQMLAVSVESIKGGLRFGVPSQLFEGAYRMNRPARGYDVSPDGKFFYLIQSVLQPVESIATLQVVQNWSTELARLAPR